MKNVFARKSLFVVLTSVATLLLAACASRSPIASQIINIPPPYADKMENGLNATGFQQDLIVSNTFSQYNKAILNVSQSSPMIENSSLDYIKTCYLVYNDADIDSEIVNYAQGAYSSAFSNSTYFTLTGQPGPGVLKIDVFITQVVPNDAFWGTLGNIPSPSWILTKPISMGIHYISSSGGGAVAMEAVVSDSQSGQVLAVFASREKDSFALFNTHGFTISGSGKAIIDIWSTDLVSTLDQLRLGGNGLTAAQIQPLMNVVQ